MMKTLLFLGLFLLVTLAVPTTGKVFERCELARLLRKKGFEGFAGHRVADWVCLAEHESSYKTNAVDHEKDSSDYGIFQISSKYWCDDDKTPGSKNMCKISCYKLMDDNLNDDIKCAKKIAKEPQGLKSWTSWKNYCQGNIDYYVKGCF